MQEYSNATLPPPCSLVLVKDTSISPLHSLIETQIETHSSTPLLRSPSHTEVELSKWLFLLQFINTDSPSGLGKFHINFDQTDVSFPGFKHLSQRAKIAPLNHKQRKQWKNRANATASPLYQVIIVQNTQGMDLIWYNKFLFHWFFPLSLNLLYEFFFPGKLCGL